MASGCDSYDCGQIGSYQSVTLFIFHFPIQSQTIFSFVLRKVCRKLRDFIDKKDPGIKEIYVDINAFASSSMLVDCKTISYTDRDEGCTVKLYNRSEKYIEKTALNAMKDDLAVIMKNPKLRLDKFSVSAYGNSKKVVEWLEEYHNSQNIYKTKRIKMEYLESSDVISMLSYFKPRVLEEIGIRCLANFTNISEVSNLFELEQWKKAKSLTMSSMEHFNFPIEHLFHFSKFTVFWTKCSVDDAIKFRDVSLNSYGFLIIKLFFRLS